MAERVTIDRVGKTFRGTGTGNGQADLPVLHDVRLTVGDGEFVAVLGPSGCGKSTLLRLVAGLDQPTTGIVRLGDRVVSGVDPRCAVVFQEPRLLPWRSVASNVALGARRLGMKAKPRPDGLLDQVGLAGFGGAYPHQLSGGMAQRAALARALIGQPQVLLLDEPFASLDALTRLRMQDLLAGICQRFQPTVVMVTHDVDEALALADRIIIMGNRPATIATVIPVTESRPRDRGSAHLAALRAEILTHFGFSIPRVAESNHAEPYAAIA